MQNIAKNIPTPLIWPLFIVGMVCVLIALLGIYGVCAKRRVLGRCVLGVYGTVIVLAVIVEISLGGALFAWNSGDDFVGIGTQEARLLNATAARVYPLCCNELNHTVLPPHPAGGDDDTCPIPEYSDQLTDADCASAAAMEGALERLLKLVVVPLAAAALGLAALQVLALTAVCCVAGKGREQAARAKEAAQQGRTQDPSEVFLLSSNLYGDSAGDGGGGGGRYAVLASTPAYRAL